MKLPSTRINDIDELIAVYFSGSLSSSQLTQLHDWINASHDNKIYFLKIREVWFSSICASDTERFNKEKAYRDFINKNIKKRNRFTRNIWPTLLRVSAVAAIILIVSFFAYHQGSNTIKKQFTNIVMEAPLGSTTKIYLPNSTLVWLNAGSKITYSQGFGVVDRQVQLSGEGYFEVTKNENLPMKVITKELVVEVVGTTFNFKNYQNDEETTVVLEEGKIISHNQLKPGDNLTLCQNQKVTLNKRTKTMKLSNVVSKNGLGWINGSLFFDGLPLHDIIRTLERNYNVKISVTDESLNTYRFYGHFSRTENTIRDVLDKLAGTNKLKYTINGSEVVLFPVQNTLN